MSNGVDRNLMAAKVAENNLRLAAAQLAETRKLEQDIAAAGDAELEELRLAGLAKVQDVADRETAAVARIDLEEAQAVAGVVSATAGVDAKLAQAQGSASAAATHAASAAAVTGLSNLSAAAKAIVSATDVVAAFIYDTTKDSDCGLWRLKQRNRSWSQEPLNTATRGVRATFPSKALLVTRNASLTIYDLDDPACPMWMVFLTGSAWPNAFMIGSNGTTLGDVKMLNGVLVSGTTNYNLTRIDFITEQSILHAVSNSAASGHFADIARRNTSLPLVSVPSTFGFNAQINSVDLTVLPGTPKNPQRCGLPNPAIIAGTAGGGRVILPDGRITGSSYTGSMRHTKFTPKGDIIWSATDAPTYIAHFPHYLAASWGHGVYATGGHPSWFPSLRNVLPTALAPIGGKGFAKGSAAGVDFIAREGAIEDPSSVAINGALAAYVSDKFNTGWMPGNIRMALAESSADLTPMEALTNPVLDDFDAYTDPASVVAAGWVFTGISHAVTGDGGRLRIEKIAEASGGGPEKAFPTVAGRRYRVAVEVEGYVRLEGPPGVSTRGVGEPASRVITAEFIATAATTPIRFNLVIGTGWAPTGTVSYVDNLTMTVLADDRSVIANHPKVVGTVTREAVAAGAELACYSGLSAENYLEAPSLGNFGTSDFMIAGSVWRASTGATGDQVLAGNNPLADVLGSGLTGAAWVWFDYVSSSNARIVFSCRGSDGTLYSAYGPLTSNVRWTYFVAVREPTALKLYVDGNLVATTVVPASLTINTTTPFLIRGSTNYPKQALIRVAHYAPTKAQIERMYADDLPMFQPGAACLLKGSPSVLAMDYDPDAEELGVGTAAGTNWFKGLCRIDFDTQGTVASLDSTERAVNGSFDTDTLWVKGGGWAISGGKATKTPGTPSFITNDASAYAPVAGETFAITYTLSGVSGGTLRALIGDVNGPDRTADGTYTDIITATGSTRAQFYGYTTFSGSVDNVSVRKVLVRPLSNDNHKVIAAKAGIRVIGSNAEVYGELPAVPMREKLTADLPGPVYNPNLATFDATTTNATPTKVAKLLIAEGAAFSFIAHVTGVEHGKPASGERARYRVSGVASRDSGGNVVVTSAVTVDHETTATMDCVAEADTASQTLDIKVTGVAAKNIVWSTRFELVEVGNAAA